MFGSRIQARIAGQAWRVGIRSLLIAAPLVCALPAHAETRGYVISWFATATNATDFKANCPQDKNGGGLKLAIRNLMDIGYSREEATEMANDPKSENRQELQDRITHRARVNGKAVSVYNYPEAVPDPNIETVTGKYAYGFDLSGKASAMKFEDPQTHEAVDNQLWRAVGCTESFRAAPPAKPYPEELSWNTMIDSAPAWALQISGADLSHDGPVTVTLDRVFQHLERDAAGDVMSNATYVIDPSPRSHNVLQGQLKDGQITVRPKDIFLEAEMPYYFDVALKQAHMRFSTAASGKLIAYWGGYLEWLKFAYMYTSRPANGADSIGIYHALKKMADFDPDPLTGQNREISTTFRMEAVPAFLASEDGKILAGPAGLAAPAMQVASTLTDASAAAASSPAVGAQGH